MKETKYKGYFVDEEGNVFSNKTGKLRKISLWLTSKGRYWTFRIGSKNILVHRLLAETFIENPENKPEINHKDNDSKNNKIENLEWCTRKENMRHCFKTQSPVRNFRKVSVYKDDMLIGGYQSVTEACRVISSTYNISFSMLDKHRDYKGFKIIKQ